MPAFSVPGGSFGVNDLGRAVFGGLAGGLLGSRVPGISCKAAGIIGGAVLCCIGAKLLLEGIGVI